jgi:hypothetical protein
VAAVDGRDELIVDDVCSNHWNVVDGVLEEILCDVKLNGVEGPGAEDVMVGFPVV